MKIIVINGPNLNLLGSRDSETYGENNLEDITNMIQDEFGNDEFIFYQSNIEGEIVDKIQEARKNFHGLIINPGGYSHTSVAIRDALEILKIPKIEVHLSNLAERDNFRQNLITASSCDGYISGFKENSYLSAVYLLKKMV